MTVHSFSYNGQEYHFEVENPKDEVQRHHAQGKFYEQRWLETHARFIPAWGIIVDVGANVGNHTIYYLKHLKIANVIAFEPNPAAKKLFFKNLELNGLLDAKNEHGFPLIPEHHIKQKLALGSSPRRAKIHQADPNNLGGACVSSEGNIDIEVVRFDDVWSIDDLIDFVKIDVEGMEMDVLKGFHQTITKWRPVIAIELGAENKREFQLWLQRNRYMIIDAYIGYRGIYNYIVIPQ